MIPVRLPLLNASIGSADDRLKTLVDEYYVNNPIETAIIEETCSTFDESGPEVLCDPVEDFPMSVVSEIKPSLDGHTSVVLTRGGKNLFDASMVTRAFMEYDETTGLWTVDTKRLSGSIAYWASFFAPVAGGNVVMSSEQVKNLIRVPPNTQITIRFNDMDVRTTDGSALAADSYIWNVKFYNKDGTSAGVDNVATYGTDTMTRTSPNVEPCYLDLKRYTATRLISFSSIQIEIGNKATAYEPYCGETSTADFPEPIYGGSLDWNTGVLTVTHGIDGAELVEPYTIQLTPQEILGFDGSNYFYSSTGDTHVSGYTPPKAIIEKLTNSVLALGGNV